MAHTTPALTLEAWAFTDLDGRISPPLAASATCLVLAACGVATIS